MPSQRHPSILKYCAIALLTVTFMLQGCSPNDFINSDDTSAVQGNATVEQANALFNQGKNVKPLKPILLPPPATPPRNASVSFCKRRKLLPLSAMPN
ncbi:hypothetical protein [Thiothrix subterranea]|uniref:hypothetical protein n=1 Tax=Thiothrix subterranea TaxID=2735563 RepID=UPI00280B9622|nr:hypothetical protein [Thiothrix subterranea]